MTEGTPFEPVADVTTAHRWETTSGTQAAGRATSPSPGASARQETEPDPARHPAQEDARVRAAIVPLRPAVAELSTLTAAQPNPLVVVRLLRILVRTVLAYRRSVRRRGRN